MNVDSMYYKFVLEELLSDANRRSRPDLGPTSPLLKHDNAPVNATAEMKEAIEDLDDTIATFTILPGLEIVRSWCVNLLEHIVYIHRNQRKLAYSR